MNFLRRQLPLVIVFLVGVTMIVQYYSPHKLSRQVGSEASDWFIIVQGVVLMLGVVSLLQNHVQKIQRQTAGWGYSLLVFIGMSLMIVVGILYKGDESTDNPYTWLYRSTMAPLQATLFSMLAFFIASAAYRAFRARSFDATLLLLAAVIVMIGRVPIGDALLSPITKLFPIGLGIDLEFVERPASAVVDWIMNYPNVAANRAIRMGVALGIIATSLKIIAGIERSYLGGGE